MYAKLCAARESGFSGRKLWPKKIRARTRVARVRSRRTASTAVRPVKAPATQSNLTVIARTKSVREISDLPEGIAKRHRMHKKSWPYRQFFLGFCAFLWLCNAKWDKRRRLSLMPGDHDRQVLGHRGIEVVKSLLLLLSFLKLAQNQIADCEVVVERRVSRLEADRSLMQRNRFARAAGFRKRHGQTVISEREIRMIANQNSIDKFGVLELAEVIVSHAHVVAGFQKTAVEPDRLLKSFEGPRVLLQLTQRLTQIVLSLGRVPVELDRALKSADSFLEITACQIDVAGVQIRDRSNPGLSGSDDSDRLVGLDRVVIAAFLLRDLRYAGQALRLFRDIGSSLRSCRKRPKPDQRRQHPQGCQSQEIWVYFSQNVSRALASIPK